MKKQRKIKQCLSEAEVFRGKPDDKDLSLYTENCKMLIREKFLNLNKWRDTLCSQTGR